MFDFAFCDLFGEHIEKMITKLRQHVGQPKLNITHDPDYTEVSFSSFLSGGFITAIVVNSPKKKLAKRTSVHYPAIACTTICWVLRLESPVGNE